MMALLKKSSKQLSPELSDNINPWWWSSDHNYHNDHVIKLIVMMIINNDDQDDDRFVEEIVEAAGPRALMAHGTQSTSARQQKLGKVNCSQVSSVHVIFK